MRVRKPLLKVSAGSRLEGSPELTPRLCATYSNLRLTACSCERVRTGVAQRAANHTSAHGLPPTAFGGEQPLHYSLFRYHVNVSLTESRLGPLAEREPGNPDSQI